MRVASDPHSPTYVNPRLWRNRQVQWELVVLYLKWLRLVWNYLLNKVLGAEVDPVDVRVLDPRWPMRQFRRRLWVVSLKGD